MNEKETKSADWINEAIYWLSRPYIFVVVFSFCFLPITKMAQALESGADFLNIPTDAKGPAMGAANTAMASGAASLFYNAAGLSDSEKSELAFMHAVWIEGGAYDSVNLALPGRKWAFGISYARLDYGSFQARAADRSANGSFSAYDRSISLAASGKVGGINLGIAAKSVKTYAAGYSASALAADIGIMKRAGSFSFGISAKNLGQNLKMLSGETKLPLSVNIGAAINIIPQAAIAVDIQNLVRDGETTIKVGSEYNLFNTFAIRGGYASAIDSGQRNITGFSGGFGFQFANMGIDYSFTPFADFGFTKRVNLSYKF